MARLAEPGGKRENDMLARCRATVIDLLNHPMLFNLSRPAIAHWFLGNRDNATMIYIWRQHGIWDAVYRVATQNVCSLIGRDYDEVITSLEQIHTSTSDGTSTNRRNARPNRT